MDSDTGAPYYVVNFFIKLDESILNIHPPDEIRRAPRSFNSDFSLLKASELRSFCLFYSCVVLQGILPSKYYNHWLLVVNVFRILYQQPIPKSDLLPAKLLADKFIIEMETLYGEDKISYNVQFADACCRCCRAFGRAVVQFCFHNRKRMWGSCSSF